MKVLFLSMFLFNLFLNSYGQSDSRISSNDVVEIVDELSTHLLSDYLYPKKAELIVGELKEFTSQLEDNQQIVIEEFTNEVNALLFDVTKDHHLKFYYDKQKFETFKVKNETIIDSIEREQYRRVNFGVQRVENLTNNIGLLRLNKFQQYDDVKQVLLGAMMTIANADAIIIDLRINGGGDGKTKEYLEAFFLSEAEFFSRETEFIDNAEYISIKESCSSCNRIEEVPLYILTGNGTFSAAEGFCYDIQQSGRGQVIGTRTRGGGHSGSSIALSKGFLIFIPTSGKLSPIEGVGIEPNEETSEKQALLAAKKQIIEGFVSNCTDSILLQQYKWNAQTVNAYLSGYQMNNQILQSFVGEYSRGFSVQIFDDELFLLNDQKGMQSRLIPIDEGYFIVGDNTDFGEGNYRIQFLSDGRAHLQVNLGVKVAEMPLVKKN